MLMWIAALVHQATQKGAPSSFRYASNTGNPILECPQLSANPTYFTSVRTSLFGQDLTMPARDAHGRFPTSWRSTFDSANSGRCRMCNGSIVRAKLGEVME